MLDQQVINIVIGVAAALGGWWMKAMWEGLKSLERSHNDLGKEISQVRVLVAGEYVRKADLDILSDALFKRLDRIQDKLDGKADKP